MSFLSMLRDNPTAKELKIRRKLKHNKLNFVFQQPLKINNKPIIVDFFHAKKKIIVEIDGNAHINLLKDIYRDYWLLQQGYLVLRYNNDQKIKFIVEDIKSNIYSNSVREKSIDKLNRFFKFTFERYFFQSNNKLIKFDILNKEKYEPISQWKNCNNIQNKERETFFRFVIMTDIANNKYKCIECKNKVNKIIQPIELNLIERDKVIRILIDMGMVSHYIQKIFSLSRKQIYNIKNKKYHRKEH